MACLVVNLMRGSINSFGTQLSDVQDGDFAFLKYMVILRLP